MIISLNPKVNNYFPATNRVQTNKTNHNNNVSFGMTRVEWFQDVAAIFVACEVLGESLKVVLKNRKVKNYAKDYLAQNHSGSIAELHSLSSHVLITMESIKKKTNDNQLNKSTKRLTDLFSKNFMISPLEEKINGHAMKELPVALRELREKTSSLFLSEVNDENKLDMYNLLGKPILKEIDRALVLKSVLNADSKQIPTAIIAKDSKRLKLEA